MGLNEFRELKEFYDSIDNEIKNGNAILFFRITDRSIKKRFIYKMRRFRNLLRAFKE